MNMKDMLAVEFGEEIARVWDDLAEIRVRANQSTRFRKLDGGEQTGLVTDANAVQRIACRLMENSIYAREEELKQGYFTASDGCRVGVCGRLVQLDGKVWHSVLLGHCAFAYLAK